MVTHQKYSSKEQLMHNGYVAEIEHLDQPELKEFIKEKNNLTFICLDEVTQKSWSEVKWGTLFRTGRVFLSPLAFL